ncbi:hypothetical protein EDD17DRAFT_1526105 [Pisolithus thermaeus]|nr:hypothetical protein EDD17DRAFT_1526105 [Pisolithus thermaeus]
MKVIISDMGGIGLRRLKLASRLGLALTALSGSTTSPPRPPTATALKLIVGTSHWNCPCAVTSPCNIETMLYTVG